MPTEEQIEETAALANYYGEQIERLGDFFLREYPDEIGLHPPGEGVGAIDLAIALLDIPAVQAVIRGQRQAFLEGRAEARGPAEGIL